MQHDMRLHRESVTTDSVASDGVISIAIQNLSSQTPEAGRCTVNVRPYVHGLTQHLRLSLQGSMNMSGFRDSKGGIITASNCRDRHHAFGTRS